MNKTFKKLLSYTLGAILALGLGLSYAYAVGANDSNAFVTTTEWEAKVAQIEASLDNVTKTINDSNMDFMMSGPRFKASLIDGLENVGGVHHIYGDMTFNNRYHGTSIGDINNLYPRVNDIFISDTWDGRQVIQQQYWTNGNDSYSMYAITCRYALRCTNDPDYYLVFTIGGGDYDGAYVWYVQYAKLGDYPDTTTTSPKTLNVVLPLDKWWRYANPSLPPAVSRTNANVSPGTPSNGLNFIYNTNAAVQNFDASGTNAYWSALLNSTNTEFTLSFEFPSNRWAIRVTGGYHMVWPMELAGKRLGGQGDRLPNPTYQNACVAKVYSPQKRSLCLKAYLNGEIPILNE